MENGKSKKYIWITWERQVRNRSLAQELDIPLFEIDLKGSVLQRYLLSIKKTFQIIRKEKPDMVFHQNPSIVLGILIYLLKKIFNFKVIVDTHNAGIFPSEGKSIFLNKIGKFITQKADLAVVHNAQIASYIKPWKVIPFILSDPLPKTKTFTKHPKHKYNTVFFICSWSQDEPYKEVIQAAKLLETSDIKVLISGRPPSHIRDSELPQNIELIGFVDYEIYSELLYNSTAILVLTTRSDSLNCGGYEAMAYKKPCILTNTKVLKDFFGDAFLYTDLTPDSISDSIVNIVENSSFYSEKMRARRSEYLSNFKITLEDFKKSINSIK